MLPTKFPVNWPFGSEEEAKNIFSKWPPWWQSRISNPNDFSSSLSIKKGKRNLQVTPMLPTKFRINWPFVFGEEGQNRFSIWPPWCPS